MNRIYLKGDRIYFQVNDTGFFKHYAYSEIKVSYSNGRYYFTRGQNNVVHSDLFANILDKDGAAFTTKEDFELSISQEDQVLGRAIHRLVAANSTNDTLIKTGKTEYYGGIYTNDTAAEIFVKYYNKATAPTVGTDIPVLTLNIPANQTLVVDLEKPIVFENGLGIGASLGVADTDT